MTSLETRLEAQLPVVSLEEIIIIGTEESQKHITYNSNMNILKTPIKVKLLFFSQKLN